MNPISTGDFGDLSRVEGRLQPIETRYKNWRFRSRLEARWAVFFESFYIPFEYEHEGYELPSGRYLPDFRLPEMPCWAEVKPAGFSPTERRKCEELCVQGGHDVLLLDGAPDDRPYTVLFTLGGQLLDTELPLWQVLTRAHGDGFFRYITGGSGKTSNWKDWNPVYDGAITSALSARFEHGERG